MPNLTTAPTYSYDQIQLALTIMVACAGDANRAKDILWEDDLDISHATLVAWRDVKHAEAYREIADKHGTELEHEMVVRVRELALRAMKVQDEALTAAADGMDKLDAKDAAKAARDLSQVASQNTDKLLTLTGRPIEIVEDRSALQIVQSIAARFPQLLKFDQPAAIEGKAVESNPQPEVEE